MAPKSKKRNGARAPEGPSSGLEPALDKSIVINYEGLDKVHLSLVADPNEWKATKVWPASRASTDLEATTIALHLLALFSGLLPPFRFLQRHAFPLSDPHDASGS